MQYNNQPYPPYPPYQAYQAPYDPVLAEQYMRYQEAMAYKKSLRKTANSLGVLLIIFIGLELILGVAVQLIAMSASGSYELDVTSVISLLENGLLSCLIFFAAGLIYCLIKKLSFSQLFPFEKISGKMLNRLCVIGITFSLMSNYVVDMLNKVFGLFNIENSGGNIDAGSEPNVVVYFLTVAILPAFVEEFAFRGIIMGSLRPYSEGVAILVSSAMFALMHGNFVQLPFTFCCGLVFAVIDIKTNSLLPSIIVHFLNNGLSVLFDILTTYKILSDGAANACYGILFVILGVLSFIFIRKIANEEGTSFFKLNNGNEIMTYKEKLKTVSSSPTLIVFTVLMLIYCVFIIAFI